MAEHQTIDVSSPLLHQQPQHETESPADPTRPQFNLVARDAVRIAMYFIGNVILVGLSIVMLCYFTKAEKPNIPIRAWIIVYTVLSLVHLILSTAAVCSDQKRRVKVCRYINMAIFGIWWILGVYWVIHGGNTLTHGAPTLYCLAVVYILLPLITTVVLWVVLPCVLCCLACIIPVITD